MKKLLTIFLGLAIALSSYAQGVQKQEKIMGLNAYTYYPVGYEQGGNYPLIVFFPGLGEAGTNAQALLTYGPSGFIAKGYKPAALVISVQPTYGWVNETTISQVLAEITKNYHVDANKIYLTGLSAGAAGILQYALTPDYGKNIAAVVPMSSTEVSRYYPNIPDIVQLPVKFLGFCGSADAQYPKMKDLFSRLNQAKEGVAQFESVSGGHCCWNDRYSPDYKVPGTKGNIYDWMLSQSKGQVQDPPVITPPADTVPVVTRKLIATLKIYDNGDIEKK